MALEDRHCHTEVKRRRNADHGEERQCPLEKRVSQREAEVLVEDGEDERDRRVVANHLDGKRPRRSFMLAQVQRRDGEDRQGHDRPTAAAMPSREQEHRNRQREIRPCQDLQRGHRRHPSLPCSPVHQPLGERADGVGEPDHRHRPARHPLPLLCAQHRVHDHGRQESERAVGRGDEPGRRLAAGEVANAERRQPAHVPDQAEDRREQRERVVRRPPPRRDAQEERVQGRPGQKSDQMDQRREIRRQHCPSIMPFAPEGATTSRWMDGFGR